MRQGAHEVDELLLAGGILGCRARTPALETLQQSLLRRTGAAANRLDLTPPSSKFMECPPHLVENVFGH